MTTEQLPRWDKWTDLLRRDGIIGPGDRFTGFMCFEVQALKAEFAGDNYDNTVEEVITYYHDNPPLIRSPEGTVFFSVRRQDATSDEFLAIDRKYINCPETSS